MDSIPPSDLTERSFISPAEGAPDNPLNPVIRRLVESRAARLYGDRPIGDFWPPSDPRSPFEEALTVRQLCGLNLDPFIQKRSFTEKKLQALIKAIDSCIVSGERMQISEEGRGDGRASIDRPTDPLLSRSGQPVTIDHQSIWTLVEGVHPLVVSTLTSLLASACGDGSILSHIADRVSTTISVEGLEVLACCQYLTETETANILGRDKDHLKTIRDGAIHTAKEVLGDDPILSLSVLLLRGAVLVSPDLIVTQLRSSCSIEPGAARFAVTILCHAAGLVPVSTGELGKWLMTANNAQVEEFLEGMKSRFPRDNQEILSWIEGRFPLITGEHCQALLSAVGTYDETTELWFLAGEEPAAKVPIRRSASSARRRRKKGDVDRDRN